MRRHSNRAVRGEGGGETAADATATFFRELDRKGHEPLLGKATGRLLVELSCGGKRTERWFIVFDKGSLAVSQAHGAADCTFRTTKELFDGMANGEVNPMAAVLRGAATIDGDPELVVRFQRLFPGPPSVQEAR